MRITPDMTIAGYPAIRVRQLVRRVFRFDRWRHKDVASEMGISVRKAGRLVTALVDEGYLEPVTPDYPGHARWAVTRKGAGLAMASAAKPIHRATAERLVAGVLERCSVLADWKAHPYAFRVVEVLVFGSYLTDARRLGDVDLAVEYERRHGTGDRNWAVMKARIDAAHQAGRTFGNISEMYEWPRTEVRRFLIGRSGYLSLHDLDEERKFVESVPHRRLWP